MATALHIPPAPYASDVATIAPLRSAMNQQRHHRYRPPPLTFIALAMSWLPKTLLQRSCRLVGTGM